MRSSLTNAQKVQEEAAIGCFAHLFANRKKRNRPTETVDNTAEWLHQNKSKKKKCVQSPKVPVTLFFLTLVFRACIDPTTSAANNTGLCNSTLKLS